MNMKKTMIGMTAVGFLALQPLLPVTNASAETKSQKVNAADPYPGHVIKLGDKGTNVKKVQTQLNKNRIPTTVDGIFGKETEKKVKLMQKYRLMREDGIVGPSTWTALYYTRVPYPGHVTKLGDSGADVKKIQEAVNRWGTPIKVDGQFGPKTAEKVKDVQKFYKIGVDGVVGVVTWEVLFNYEE